MIVRKEEFKPTAFQTDIAPPDQTCHSALSAYLSISLFMIMTLSAQSLGTHGYRSAWAVQVAVLQAMKALWDGRLGACQGAAKAAAPVKGAAAKATNAKATAPAQGAVLHAMKATHSFCQGGSRASHECKCSYARATAPAQGAVLQAMKATHSFCQGGSRASHQGKCSYTRMQPRLPRGQSCIGHESAPP